VTIKKRGVFMGDNSINLTGQKFGKLGVDYDKY